MPPEPPAEVTTAELWRRMDAFEKTMKEGFDRLDRRVETLGYVSLDRYEADQRGIHQDLGEIRDTQKWFTRSVAALVLTIVGGAVLLFIETRGGV